MTAKSPREDEVRSAREQMIAMGLLRAAIPPSLVAKEIEQSWRRSVASHIDPGAEPRILGEIEPDSVILRAADQILDRWQANLAESRLTLFLNDEDGRIISRRILDAQDERTMDQASAVEGFNFSEHVLGTNGLGTPIDSHGTVFVRGAEHFNDSLTHLACAGAPVRHPITGRTVGSIALTSHVDRADAQMVAMARQASQEIAEALEDMADSRDLALARTYRRFRSTQHPTLVMNSATVMTDLPTLARIDSEFYAALWERLRLHSWELDELRFELPMLGSEVMVRRIDGADQDSIFAMKFLEPPAPTPTAAVADEITVIDNREGPGASAVHSLLDSAAARRTGPSSYDDVQRQLTAAAATDGLIRVTGGPGCGKRYQASRWLRQRTRKEPKVWGAGELPGENAVWVAGEAALRGGRGIIVSGGEQVSSGLSTRLQDFAKVPRPGISPDARVILTECTTGAAENEADAGTAAVRVPSLAALRDELPDIVRDVAAGLFPGAPAPRFSPDALQCLLAWSWPGNVAELAQVLTALPAEARAGLVQTSDLPVSMRATPPP